MNTFRKLLIRFRNINDLQKWYNLEFVNINKLKNRNIRINYRKSNINELVLYGYDKKEKYKSSISQTSINKMIKLIDNMPMRKLDKSINNINKLTPYSICGVFNKHPTEHCFTDGTHQTCCMLGKEARMYADKTGNPIGKAAEQSFTNYFNKKPLKNDMTPWCTCIGSKVCSFYANKFNDGTHIKFINKKDKKIIAYNFDSNCEHNLQLKFGYGSHLTSN